MGLENFMDSQETDLALKVASLILVYMICQSVLGTCLIIIVLLHTAYIIYQRRNRRNIEIRGQGVFITGCDTGFGHDLARHLHAQGFTVFAGCLEKHGNGANTLKAEESTRLHVVHLDVTNDASVQKALNYVQANLPAEGLWAVVNNAGLFCSGDVELLSLDTYKKVSEVVLFGSIRTTKAFLPLIRQSKGRVVFNGSVRGRMATARDSAYHMSKHALESFADSLRLEMLKFDVKVVIVEPGAFGAATAIISKTSLQRYRRDMEDMWEKATPEVRNIYTKAALEMIHDGAEIVATTGVTSSRTTKPVIDAMFDAIATEYPDYRYLVGGSDGFVDWQIMTARVYSWMPTSLMDFFLCKYTGCDKFAESGAKAKI